MKQKKLSEIKPILPIPIQTLTIQSAGIVDGIFKVILSNGDMLGGVDELSTKKVGYSNQLYVNIFCKVDANKNVQPLSTPISQEFKK